MLAAKPCSGHSNGVIVVPVWQGTEIEPFFRCMTTGLSSPGGPARTTSKSPEMSRNSASPRKRQTLRPASSASMSSLVTLRRTPAPRSPAEGSL